MTDWSTTWIIGGGGSARGLDVARLTGGIRLGLNAAAFAAPCDAFFSLDASWVRRHAEEIAAFAGAKGCGEHPAEPRAHVCMRVEQWQAQARREGLVWWRRVYRDQPTLEPGTLASGRSDDGCTGVAALNLAAQRGARRIVAFGYDMDEAGYDYWYDVSAGDRAVADGHLAKVPLIRDNFRRVAAWYRERGIEVWNASPGSRIDAFPIIDHERAYGMAPPGVWGTPPRAP